MTDPCLEALLNVQPFLDGELSAAESECVRHHFEVCPPCAPALGYFRNLRNAVFRAATAQPAAPADLKTRITRLIEGRPAN